MSSLTMHMNMFDNRSSSSCLFYDVQGYVWQQVSIVLSFLGCTGVCLTTGLCCPVFFMMYRGIVWQQVFIVLSFYDVQGCVWQQVFIVLSFYDVQAYVQQQVFIVLSFLRCTGVCLTTDLHCALLRCSRAAHIFAVLSYDALGYVCQLKEKLAVCLHFPVLRCTAVRWSVLKEHIFSMA